MVFASEQLAYVASAMVATLFASFVGLLIPGLASIHPHMVELGIRIVWIVLWSVHQSRLLLGSNG